MTGRLDSEVWICRGHGGTMIGHRTPDDLCRGCIDLAMTTAQPAPAPAADQQLRGTHFGFVNTVLYPSELMIRAYVNSKSAREGECIGHVELGPIDLNLGCSAEARRIAAAFIAVAEELATIEDGTWSDKTKVDEVGLA